MEYLRAQEPGSRLEGRRGLSEGIHAALPEASHVGGGGGVDLPAECSARTVAEGVWIKVRRGRRASV